LLIWVVRDVANFITATARADIYRFWPHFASIKTIVTVWKRCCQIVFAATVG
jgi:hypothetical protein